MLVWLFVLLLLIQEYRTQITFEVGTPPPPPEMESQETEPDPPSSYDDLFTYAGYFQQYVDDQQAFAKRGRRRRRHRVNCGKDRKGRHCDYRRSHHQHGFYNKECIHYAGSLEIYGVWQCGSRTHLRDGAIIRLMVELHELILKYKQDKNNYAMERFNRIVEYNKLVYTKLREIFYANAKENFQKVMQALELANAQIFKNFLSLHDMSKELINQIRKDREGDIDEVIVQLQQLLVDYPPPQSICNNIDDCDVCSDRQGCIWCTEEQSCSEGSREFGAYYESCDIWDQNKECVDYDGPRKPTYRADFTNAQDLDLSQKLYIASKQREMIQLKNQIEARRQLLSQMNNMAIMVRNKNIKIIDQFLKHELYDKQFLKQVDDEDAEGGWAIWEQEVDEMKQEYDEDHQKEISNQKEKVKKKSNKQKARDQFLEEQFKLRDVAIPIDKKPYKDKDQLGYVVDTETQKQPQ